jgi:hypothetical protein
VYEEDLNNLEDWLRRLKVEYDIFFSGNRKRPPDDLRGRVEKVVKKLSQASNMSFTERFQYNTLVARFYLYRDLWRRTATKQEMGMEKEIQGLAERAPLPSAAPSQDHGSELRVSINDPASEKEKVRELYEALVRLGGARPRDSQKITYKQFECYIAAQMKNIRDRYRCSSVVFTLSVEENSVKFKAVAADLTSPQNPSGN